MSIYPQPDVAADKPLAKDPKLHVQHDKALRVRWDVQIYQWVEKRKEKVHKDKAGKVVRTEAWCEYELEWRSWVHKE